MYSRLGVIRSRYRVHLLIGSAPSVVLGLGLCKETCYLGVCCSRAQGFTIEMATAAAPSLLCYVSLFKDALNMSVDFKMAIDLKCARAWHELPVTYPMCCSYQLVSATTRCYCCAVRALGTGNDQGPEYQFTFEWTLFTSRSASPSTGHFLKQV